MQKTLVMLTCDFFHEGETAGTETVTFAIDGVAYEADACEAHAKDVRALFEEYAEYGRRVAASTTGRKPRRDRGFGRERAGEIRAWAKERGIDVSERGRIPGAVVQQYEAATA